MKVKIPKEMIAATAVVFATLSFANGEAVAQKVRSLAVKPGDDLGEALIKLRAARQPGERGEIVFEDGVYEFTKTLLLGKEDNAVTLRAKNPGKAIMMGGWRFKGSDMKPVKDARLLKRLPESVRGKCVAIDIPEGIYTNRFYFTKYEQGGSFWHVQAKYPIFTVDTSYQRIAHWPNGRERFWWSQDTVKCEERVIKDAKGRETKNITSTLKVPRAKTWDLDHSEAFLFGCVTGWGYEAGVCKLARDPSGDPEKLKVSSRLACNTYSRGVFLNLLEEIDEPGEWSFDTLARKLVLYPRDDFRPDSLCAVATMEAPFLKLRGDGIRVEGMVFTAKAGEHAVVLDNCRYAVVAGCTFSGLHRGVTVNGRNNTILSCDFKWLQDNASTLMGGVAKTLECGRNTVENCSFEEFGAISGGYADAVIVEGCGNAVRHCVMHGALGHAMDIRGSENLVEYCRIYDVCRDHDDSGAVYANGPVSYGSVLRYNDIGTSVGMSSGIYLDDFCCGVTLYGNILRNVGHFGVFLSGGRDLTVENNLFTACWGGIRLDNRGLFWDAWKDKGKYWSWMCTHFGLTNASPFAVKYPRMTQWMAKDGTNMLTGPVDNTYKNNLFVDNEGLSTSFLVCLSREIPEGRTTFKGNLAVRTKGLQPGKNDMASGDSKKVPDNKHTQKPGPNYTYTRAFEVRADGKLDGRCERIRVLDGTPEQPIDLGFVNLPKDRADLSDFYWDQQGWVDEDKLRAKREKGYEQKPYEVGDLSLKPDARLLKEMPDFRPIPFAKIGLYRDQWRTDPALREKPEPDPMPVNTSWWKLW